MNPKPILLAATLLSAAVYTATSQPVISTQPQSQTNIVGTTATFSVEATNALPIFYQWQFNSSDLTDQTNTTLVLTNVQTGNEGPYTVVVSNVEGSVTSAVATLTVLVPLTISRQPANQSVSLGANPAFTFTASGSPPMYYHLRFNQSDLPGKTNLSTSILNGTLVVTNVQATNAGDYSVVLTNFAGSATSQVATLTVDPTFTKITTGAVVTDLGLSAGCAWCDYNNDGYLDLFVANTKQFAPNFLYRNNADGTFTKISTGSIVTDGGNSTGCAWGDFDNDGSLDLFVANAGRSSLLPNFLYHNNGDGTFSKITSGSVVTDRKVSYTGAWSDYDNDGYVDLFVADDGYNHGSPSNKNSLYRNTGAGTFTTITSGSIVNYSGGSIGGAWADYNNDGFSDLFVVNGSHTANNFLYRNQGDGTFVAITSGSIVNSDSNSVACAWGDYDNDGFPDLFVSNGGNETPEKNFLYHNKGEGTFEKIISGSIVTDVGTSVGCAWGDYDNDGFLDLFVCRHFGQTDLLYHNSGDGTFTRVTAGSLANDAANSVGCAWGDYDNDGFLDLFVANGAFAAGVSQNNFLYRNNGNSNNWIKIKLVGTVSNRAAIGAKVRVRATIGGKAVLQLREISSGSGISGQNTLAHFGLGDATNTDVVRIEWPSGIVQMLTNVPVKQFLTVVEHQQPGATNSPSFANVSRATNGVVSLAVAGDTGLLYLFEASSNLVNWTKVGVSSNATGVIAFTDSNATNYASRFYRVSVP